MMKDLAKKGFSLGLGLLVMTKEQVEKAVDELVKKGKISADESKKMVNRLIEAGEKERERLDEVLREKVKKILSELDVPSKRISKRWRKGFGVWKNVSSDSHLHRQGE